MKRARFEYRERSGRLSQSHAICSAISSAYWFNKIDKPWWYCLTSSNQLAISLPVTSHWAGDTRYPLLKPSTDHCHLATVRYHQFNLDNQRVRQRRPCRAIRVTPLGVARHAPLANLTRHLCTFAHIMCARLCPGWQAASLSLAAVIGSYGPTHSHCSTCSTRCTFTVSTSTAPVFTQCGSSRSPVRYLSRCTTAAFMHMRTYHSAPAYASSWTRLVHLVSSSTMYWSKNAWSVIHFTPDLIT